MTAEHVAEMPPGEEPAGRTADASPAAAVCPFPLCPICTSLAALGQARPEVTEHLLLASKEVLLALRALIDARLEGPAATPAPRVERLTIE